MRARLTALVLICSAALALAPSGEASESRCPGADAGPDQISVSDYAAALQSGGGECDARAPGRGGGGAPPRRRATPPPRRSPGRAAGQNAPERLLQPHL